MTSEKKWTNVSEPFETPYDATSSLRELLGALSFSVNGVRVVPKETVQKITCRKYEAGELSTAIWCSELNLGEGGVKVKGWKERGGAGDLQRGVYVGDKEIGIQRVPEDGENKYRVMLSELDFDEDINKKLQDIRKHPMVVSAVQGPPVQHFKASDEDIDKLLSRDEFNLNEGERLPSREEARRAIEAHYTMCKSEIARRICTIFDDRPEEEVLVELFTDCGFTVSDHWKDENQDAVNIMKTVRTCLQARKRAMISLHTAASKVAEHEGDELLPLTFGSIFYQVRNLMSHRGGFDQSPKHTEDSLLKAIVAFFSEGGSDVVGVRDLLQKVCLRILDEKEAKTEASNAQA